MVSKMSDYHDRKAKIHKYLGGQCVKCGSSENMHVDHIDPKDKAFTILENWAISWDRLQAELDKCQLLCRSCHLKKSSEEGSLSKVRVGENCNFAKLTEDEVLEIRAKYEPQTYSMTMLAEDYGVSRKTISNIVNRKSWKHI